MHPLRPANCCLATRQHALSSAVLVAPHQPSILRRPKMDPDSALRPSPWMTSCPSDSICARTICPRWLLALQHPSMSYAQRSVLPGSALIIQSCYQRCKCQIYPYQLEQHHACCLIGVEPGLPLLTDAALATTLLCFTALATDTHALGQSPTGKMLSL